MSNIFQYPNNSRGHIEQVVQQRDTGARPWDRRLATSPWAARNNSDAAKLLAAAAEWRCLTKSMVRCVLGEKEKGRRALQTIHRLSDLGIPNKDDSKREYLYSPAGPGYFLMTRRDRVAPVDAEERLEAGSHRAAREPKHEEVTRRVAGESMRSGVNTAEGRRTALHLN